MDQIKLEDVATSKTVLASSAVSKSPKCFGSGSAEPSWKMDWIDLVALWSRGSLLKRILIKFSTSNCWTPATWTEYSWMLFPISFLKWTCEGGERKPARVFSVKPARKMISNIDYPIISHLSNMPTFFWAKTRQIRGADTPRGRNVPGKEAGQRQTKWHTVWCAISICHTWPRR